MSKITTKWITNDAVDKAKINADVAGNGLEQAAGGELQIKPDATTGGNVANVINVAANGAGVNIDNSTIKVVGGQLVASGCTEKLIMHKITAGEVTAGYFTLPDVPVNPTAVRVDVQGGPMQLNLLAVGSTAATCDFTILANPSATVKDLYFKNKTPPTGLSEDIDVNDILIIRYEL